MRYYTVWNQGWKPSGGGQTLPSRIIRCFSGELFFFLIYQLFTTQFSQPQSSAELIPQKQHVNEASVMHDDHQEQVEEPEVGSFSRSGICRLGVVNPGTAPLII